MISAGSSDSEQAGYYSKATLRIAGISGFIVTCFGTALAFFPPPNITSKGTFEIKMWAGTIVLLALAGFFFFVYGNRKTAPQVDLTRA